MLKWQNYLVGANALNLKKLKTISLNIYFNILILRTSGTNSLDAVEELERGGDRYIVPR